MRLALVCFYCLCVFVYVLYFIATMSFAGYFLPILFCMLSMLISDSRFDLVWFRLSCDHGWIRSGSVNVRKQQQRQQPHTISPFLYLPFYFFAATTKCLYKQHLLPTSLLASIILRCDHGPDSLHAVICDKLTFFTRDAQKV